jgi:hypothetical protein
MNYLLGVLLFMTLGVVFANIIVELGLASVLNRLIRPFIRFSNLSGEVGTGAIVRALSPSAGYAALAEFYKRGRIGEREVILTTLLATFPYFLVRLPAYYLPVVIPLLGTSLGVKYLGIKTGSTLIQTSAAVIYGRFCLEARPYEGGEASRKGDLRVALLNSLDTLRRVVPIFLVATAIIMLLIRYGTIGSISRVAEPATQVLSLPGESALVIAAQLANMPAGFVVAGGLLREGILTEEQALLTLVVGLIIAGPRIFLQYSLPVVTSLFHRGLAVKVVACKIVAEAVSLLVFIPFLL